MKWLRDNCTFIWRSIFTLALGWVGTMVWSGGGKIGELVIALNGIPAAVERVEKAVASHETRITVLEALRVRDAERPR